MIFPMSLLSGKCSEKSTKMAKAALRGRLQQKQREKGIIYWLHATLCCFDT